MWVTNILERILLVLFIYELSDHLRSWVKGHDLATLQEATKKACDLTPYSFKRIFQSKDSHMKKDKDKDKKHFY